MFYNDNDINKYYKYALALTNNNELAFDLVHDALIKVQTKFFFKKDAYILTTIRNLFFNSIKKKDNNYSSLERIEAIDSIDLEEITAEKFDIHALLAILTEEEREIIFLIEVEGYTYKEVANLKGISKGTLLSKLHRLKKRLKKWSEKNG